MKYIFDLRENNGMMRKNVKIYENIYRWIIFLNFEILECWRLFFQNLKWWQSFFQSMNLKKKLKIKI